MKHLRAEASSSLSEIAGQIVQEGYTRGLIQAFSGGGAELAPKSFFSELEVSWVLETGKINLLELEKERTTLDDLVRKDIISAKIDNIFRLLSDGLRGLTCRHR